MWNISYNINVQCLRFADSISRRKYTSPQEYISGNLKKKKQYIFINHMTIFQKIIFIFWLIYWNTFCCSLMNSRFSLYSCKCDTSVIQVWYECDTIVIRVWYKCDTSLIKVWYKCDTMVHRVRWILHGFLTSVQRA